MRLRPYLGATLALTALVTCACTEAKSPLAPKGSTGSGSGLKVGPPTKTSPIGGLTLTTRNPTLTLRSATGSYDTPVVSYEFEVTTTAGDAIYTRTVPGGPADGITAITHAMATSLPPKGQFRWRARAVLGGIAGPWSDSSTTGSANFITNTLTASSTNAEFRDFFFKLIEDKGVGPVPSQQAFITMEPDLVGADIIIAKDSSGFIRGRIYLPTFGADRYTRSVDVITGFGGNNSWRWNEIGATKCEGICP